MFFKTGLLLAFIAVAFASPLYEAESLDQESLSEYYPMVEIEEYEPLYLVRTRRDISFDPHINKEDGTTNAGGSITHKGDNHEVTGHWNKNVAGPGKAKPNYGIRGSFKW